VFAQRCRGKSLDVHRTESDCCPSESEADSSVNPEFGDARKLR
jgi:hypothetical protein